MPLFNNRGLAYGDGFFTTMGCYNGKILWFEYHLERLISHTQALQLDIDITAIGRQLTEYAKQVDEGMLKLIIVRQPQAVRGYGFVNGKTAVLIHPKPMPMPAYHSLSQTLTKSQIKNNDTFFSYPIQPIGEAIQLASKIACSPASLLGLKSLNRLDNVLAAGELEQRKQSMNDNNHAVDCLNIVEGLVSDISDTFGKPTSWVEGVMSNVFYQLHTNKKDRSPPWYTPPLDRSGVNGVMRQVLIDQLQETNTPVIPRRLTDADFSQISSLFFCNSVKGVTPISKLHLLTGEELSFSWNGV